METLLYIFARVTIALLQAMPLGVVARLGRFFGAIFYALDARHRQVAIDNLQLAFPEKPAAEVREIARENFKRIGENFAAAANTAGASAEEIDRILSVTGVENSRVAAVVNQIASFLQWAIWAILSSTPIA